MWIANSVDSWAECQVFTQIFTHPWAYSDGCAVVVAIVHVALTAGAHGELVQALGTFLRKRLPELCEPRYARKARVVATAERFFDEHGERFDRSVVRTLQLHRALGVDFRERSFFGISLECSLFCHDTSPT